MKKKLLLLSVIALAGLGLSAVSVSAAGLARNTVTKGETLTYSFTLDSGNSPSSSSYSVVAKTGAGNDFTVNYTGTHSTRSGCHTVLGSGAYIWNSASPVCHLTSVSVDLDGDVTLSGGQVSSSLYETHQFTGTGSYTFIDEMNYFKILANAETAIRSITFTYTSDCATGTVATTRTIALDGVPATLEAGKSQAITPSTNSNGALSVVSSDPTIATITQSTGKGGTTYKVNAVKEGTCKIYAVTDNGLKSNESTLKVISVGMPANTIGNTYRCVDPENAYGHTASITVNSSSLITLTYDSVDYGFTFSETTGNARVFYDDAYSYSDLQITPSSDGTSLEVFGTVYDDNIDELVTFGNTHTNTGDSFAKYVRATSLTLNKTSLTLDYGKSEKLTATVLPDNATNSTVTWTSSDESVAAVTAGTVRAIAAGTCTITAENEDSGLKATCSVTVNGSVAVTSVTVSGPTTVKVGASITLTATAAPSNATETSVTWASSDSTVAKISSKGVVTGVSAGSVNITATIGGVTSAAYAVTVTADSDPIPAKYQGTFVNSEDLYSTVNLIVGGNSVRFYDDDGYVDLTLNYVSTEGNKIMLDDDFYLDDNGTYLYFNVPSGYEGIDDFYNLGLYGGDYVTFEL